MDLEKLHREESGRILSTLIRLLGDFDLAEEMLQEAYATALQKWPLEGLPANPVAWLVSTARHKAIDRLRREHRFELKQAEIARYSEFLAQPAAGFSPEVPPGRETDVVDTTFPDDRLRLIFTCCHPGLAQEAQVALTLRTVCGITTEELSRAFLVPVSTMAQRLVRAKRKIHDAGIPYGVPSPEELPGRLDAVLLVVYLIFNEGYLASSGDALVRRELCAEAIRLGRVLCELLEGQSEGQPEGRSEVEALLGLMLLHNSRCDARLSADGELILLEDQDRSLWDGDQIREGTALTELALRGGASGVYALQASISALHANARTARETDWPQIAALYSILLSIHSSPVIAVNRAVAVAMAGSPEDGLALLDDLEKSEELREFHLLPAARADLLRRLGRMAEASEAYRRALSLATNDVERRFLRGRLSQAEATSYGESTPR
jgi:RNA polymerase sigma-70 factor (ECF subfamily)